MTTITAGAAKMTYVKFTVYNVVGALIWGIGLDAKTASQTPPDAWPGQNLLGKVLTEVRETLSWLHPEEAAACAPFGGKP